jgi:cardiolipin synthase
VEALTLANALTALRIVLVPAFITALEYARYDLALYVFALAAATDALDGLAARRLGEKTTLGRVLDPVADKLMLVSSFLYLAYRGYLPAWLAIVVVSRDALVVTGAAALSLAGGTPRVEPTISGKAAIALQFILLVYVLLKINYGPAPSVEGVLIALTAALTVLSGLHYIYRGMKIAA